MEDHEQGREAFASDEEYQLHCLRHSTAHVMAQAIMKVYPESRQQWYQQSRMVSIMTLILTRR